MIVKGVVYAACTVAAIVTGIGFLGWWVVKQYMRIVKDDDL